VQAHRGGFSEQPDPQPRDEVKDQTLGTYLSASELSLPPWFAPKFPGSLYRELLLLKVQAAFAAWQGRRNPPAGPEKRGESFFSYNVLYSDCFTGLFVLTYA